jgi:uncharacterized protein
MNHRWKRTFALPSRIKTAMLNYLNFFREYIAATDKITLDVEYRTLYDGEQTRLELTLVMESEHLQTLVMERLRDYMSNIFRDPTHDFAPELHAQKSLYETELLLVLYRRALADIRTDIRFHHNLFSESERERLVHAFALLSMHTDFTETPLYTLPEESTAGVEKQIQEQIEKQIQALRFPSEKEELPRALQNALSHTNTASSLALRTYNATHYIQHLALGAHPEGGWFRETYCSDEEHEHLPRRYAGGRAFSTAIYFLLEHGQFSALHRIQSDELWHFYDGAPLLITCIAPNGALSEIRLGRNSSNGEVLQAVVPKGWWFGSELLGEIAQGVSNYALVGCTVAPGFDFADFEMPSQTTLMQMFPQHRRLIERLTKADNT